MTIDEYLGQARQLKNKADIAEAKLKEAESRAINPRSSLNLGDGIPANTRNGNGTETRLIEYIDAGKAYRIANDNYRQFREQLQNTTLYLLHWQALLIEQVYIHNVYYDRDDEHGADEIIKAKTTREFFSKLAEAKKALADALRAQGVEIEM